MGFGAWDCFAAEGAGPEASFYKGNMAYEQAKYDEAIVEYRAALQKGFESGNIYYNLGNAHFKKGELGIAILNYKRAERLIPQDADLKANLEYAQSFVEQVPGPKVNFILRFIQAAVSELNLDALTRLPVVLYCVVFLLGAFLLFVKTLRRPLVLALAAGCALLAVSSLGFFARINQMNQPLAIVIDKQIEARYEPFDSATAYFKLSSGQQVLAVKSKAGWLFVKRPDGKSGWVKSEAVEKI